MGKRAERKARAEVRIVGYFNRLLLELKNYPKVSGISVHMNNFANELLKRNPEDRAQIFVAISRFKDLFPKKEGE